MRDAAISQRELAARRAPVGGDARAVSDVRGRRGRRAGSPRSRSAPATPRPARSVRSTTSAPIRASTTSSPCRAACGPTSRRRSCGRSSPNDARDRERRQRRKAAREPSLQCPAEGCESGRIGWSRKPLWRKSPWVQIPLPPPRNCRSGHVILRFRALGTRGTFRLGRVFGMEWHGTEGAGGHPERTNGDGKASFQLVVYAGRDGQGRDQYVRRTLTGVSRREASKAHGQLVVDVQQGRTAPSRSLTVSNSQRSGGKPALATSHRRHASDTATGSRVESSPSSGRSASPRSRPPMSNAGTDDCARVIARLGSVRSAAVARSCRRCSRRRCAGVICPRLPSSAHGYRRPRSGRRTRPNLRSSPDGSPLAEAQRSRLRALRPHGRRPRHASRRARRVALDGGRSRRSDRADRHRRRQRRRERHRTQNGGRLATKDTKTHAAAP